MNTASRAETLRAEISRREAELGALKTELFELESQNQHASSSSNSPETWSWPLKPEEYTRYGRQMILPQFGLPGQLRLRASKVLIIGVGGLGCPAAAYLAGAGIGTLALVDGDDVELSNLHRQILHSHSRVGMKKVESAVMALNSMNPLPQYISYPEHLNPISALQIFPQYDLILDCTDTPQTRYLISDAAVLSGKPLISASALRFDGQLVILNHPITPPLDRRSTEDLSGPCYRCIFPKPPPPESVTSCGEGGILGPVVGVMGVLMALEAIKLLTSGSVSLQDMSESTALSSKASTTARPEFSLMIISASGPEPSTFRRIRLKGKRKDCSACGKDASITTEHVTSGSLDYAVFCGIASPITVLSKEERIDVQTLSTVLKLQQAGHSHANGTEAGLVQKKDDNAESTSKGLTSLAPILLDVRDEAQFSICSLPGSINVPWNILASYKGAGQGEDALLELKSSIERSPSSDIYSICRLGNDSQLAVRKLQELGIGTDPGHIKDIVGGFKSWKQEVDNTWPEY